MYMSSKCCKNIAAIMLDIGDPMAIPCSSCKIICWNVKYFCDRTSMFRVRTCIWWTICAGNEFQSFLAK